MVQTHNAIFSGASGDDQSAPSSSSLSPRGTGAATTAPATAAAAEEGDGAWSFERAVVVEPYYARTIGELSLKAQDLVLILDKGVDGWWIGENGDFTGLFPSKVCAITTC
jgi:hypothetical protein